MVVLIVELLVAGWELVIAVLTLVVVWVVMVAPDRRGLFLGPIWLPGFGFAYCLVLVSEFSRSHYCDRDVQCNIT